MIIEHTSIDATAKCIESEGFSHRWVTYYPLATSNERPSRTCLRCSLRQTLHETTVPVLKQTKNGIGRFTRVTRVWANEMNSAAVETNEMTEDNEQE